MIEAVLSIKIPGLWASDIPEKYPIKLKFIGCMPSEGRGMGLVEISGDKEVLGKAIEDIKKHPSVGSISIDSFEEDKVRIVVSVTKCDACGYLMTSGCFLMAPFSGEKGYMNWVLVTDKRESLSYLFEKLKDLGCDIQVVHVKELQEEGILTSRQAEIIKTAIEKGYFEFPKRVSIRQLAEEFGVSISTLSEILRAAEQKILKQYFETS